MDPRQGRLFTWEPAEEPWEADELRDRLIAEVALSEAPFGPYDYLVPENLRDRVEPGRRLRVPLGKGERTMVGYCVRVGHNAQTDRQLREIRGVVDARPIVSESLIRLARWLAERYLCELGVALETIVPAAVRGQAGTREQLFLSIPAEVWDARDQWRVPARQRAILETLAAAGQPLTAAELAQRAGCSSSPIQTLRDKGWIVATRERVETGAFTDRPARLEMPLELNDDQQRALDAILRPVLASQHEAIVLHGVTGSGKTEVYIRAIEEVIRRGRQAIVLVPEISLTPQTRQRFRARFPHVAVLHSNLSDAERNWHWQRIARGEVQVVVGARSAIFAPTPRLGLVVLDEEHDGSFKQDTQPRYQAREVALWRTRDERVPLVLGSATPALETWQRAREGEFTLVEMPQRVSGYPLPEVTTIDMRLEHRERGWHGLLSRPLRKAMSQAFGAGGQVILLLNRRGFASSIQCPSCGYVAQCPDCNLALTHHQAEALAVCHYCDYRIPAPVACPKCSFTGIRLAGLGTEKLEDEARHDFPNVPLLRMDSDTMKRPGSHEEALDRFRVGDVRLLIGTQMIAKGLDFPQVTLVGVVNADTALHFPDFRASERTFQLVTQVAGRTGRGRMGGHVMVQTFNPDHPAILAARRHDYAQFAAGELPEREVLGYPPFGSLVRIIVRGESQNLTLGYAELLGKNLERALNAASPSGDAPSGHVLGPAPCPLAKLRGRFRYHVLVKSRDGDWLRHRVRDTMRSLPLPRGIQWLVDVDPIDML